MAKLRQHIIATAICLLGSSVMLSPALAHDHGNHHHHHDDDYYGGAFLGGMVTNQILTNMELQSDAARQPDPVQYGNFADHRTLIEREEHPYQRTAASRMAELEQLAASGAITSKEYADKRLAIIDGL